MQEVIVTVKKNSKVEIEVKGVKGQGCVALTKEFEEKLAGAVESDVKTSEFYQQEAARVRQ